MVDVTKALDRVKVDGSLLEWMTVHGNLCLALRHPENNGPSRIGVILMIHRIGKVLVEGGILTQEELNLATRLEQDEHGMERFV